MSLYLRGLAMGVFLGVGVGALLTWQPETGWIPTISGMIGIAILGWADYAYVHRKPKAVA